MWPGGVQQRVLSLSLSLSLFLFLSLGTQHVMHQDIARVTPSVSHRALRKHALSSGQVPVCAYGGSQNNLKDIKGSPPPTFPRVAVGVGDDCARGGSSRLVSGLLAGEEGLYEGSQAEQMMCAMMCSKSAQKGEDPDRASLAFCPPPQISMGFPEKVDFEGST